MIGRTQAFVFRKDAMMPMAIHSNVHFVMLPSERASEDIAAMAKDEGGRRCGATPAIDQSAGQGHERDKHHRSDADARRHLYDSIERLVQWINEYAYGAV